MKNIVLHNVSVQKDIINIEQLKALLKAGHIYFEEKYLTHEGDKIIINALNLKAENLLLQFFADIYLKISGNSEKTEADFAEEVREKTVKIEDILLFFLDSITKDLQEYCFQAIIDYLIGQTVVFYDNDKEIRAEIIKCEIKTRRWPILLKIDHPIFSKVRIAFSPDGFNSGRVKYLIFKKDELGASIKTNNGVKIELSN